MLALVTTHLQPKYQFAVDLTIFPYPAFEFSSPSGTRVMELSIYLLDQRREARGAEPLPTECGRALSLLSFFFSPFRKLGGAGAQIQQ